MSIVNSLTASRVIPPSIMPTSTEVSQYRQNKPLKADLGIYAKDVIEISKLGIEKQQKETQVEATKAIEKIASEVVSISSTIGRAHLVGNLTSSQATKLYHKVALLL
jgi:hypothetical protein